MSIAAQNVIAWLDSWLMKHNDAFHPQSREECDHCQEMIQIYGPMPPARLLQAWEVATSKKTRPDYQKASIPEGVRWAVWERDDFTCQECGSRQFLTVDHIHPERKGGSLEPDNLQTLCRSCNSRKGVK